MFFSEFFLGRGSFPQYKIDESFPQKRFLLD